MNKVSSQTLLQNGTERLVWIDALRGFAILLVIVGHTSPPFQKLIYGFHMPLFFILSGFIFPLIGKGKILSFFGKHTIFIMGFDYFSNWLSNKTHGIIGISNWASVTILKIVVLIIGICIWYGILKILPEWKIKNYLRY